MCVRLFFTIYFYAARFYKTTTFKLKCACRQDADITLFSQVCINFWSRPITSTCWCSTNTYISSRKRRAASKCGCVRSVWTVRPLAMLGAMENWRRGRRPTITRPPLNTSPRRRAGDAPCTRTSFRIMCNLLFVHSS